MQRSATFLPTNGDSNGQGDSNGDGDDDGNGDGTGDGYGVTGVHLHAALCHLLTCVTMVLQ
jgi:hypothetical protein